MMRISLIFATALAMAVPAAAQSQGDVAKKIEGLVQEYTRLEDAMDMVTQSNFIWEDRMWHGIGGRRTHNPLWMKVQQENFDSFKKAFPNVRFHREVRDLLVRVIGPDAAISSFTWFANRILPGDLPAEKVQQLGPGPVPQVVSLVWQKRGNDWKIASSHISPLYIRPQ